MKLDMGLRKLALASIAAVFMSLGAVTPATASVETFNFGGLLESGQVGPVGSSVWGTLTVTTGTSTSTSYNYIFDLSLDSSSFTTLFGSGAYVSEAIFNTPTALDPTGVSNVSGGVAGVKLIPNAPNVGGLGFDFGDCFGSTGSCNHSNTTTGRLAAGESVTWTTTFSTSQGDPLLFGTPPVGLHVQAFSTFNGSTSAWYGNTVSPVPEPETYAMLLAGLGLIGFIARRKNQSSGMNFA